MRIQCENSHERRVLRHGEHLPFKDGSRERRKGARSDVRAPLRQSPHTDAGKNPVERRTAAVKDEIFNTVAELKLMGMHQKPQMAKSLKKIKSDADSQMKAILTPQQQQKG